VRVDEDGYVHPLKPGRTTLTVSAGGKRTRVPVTVKSAANPPVSFTREVMPIMSKLGCNAGTCHGAAKGKNGFKLSLRGYDADYDYHALVDEVAGRRFNRVEPGQSLMLLKPLGVVPHKGGVLFSKQSRSYKLLERWIAEGARNDSETAAKVTHLTLLPVVPNLTLPGMKQKTLVIAHYSDGSSRDVTREAVFTSSMPEVVTTTPSGKLAAVRRGEAALLVRFEGRYGSLPLTVLGDRTGFQWTQRPQYNYVDRHIDAKLRKIKAIPSDFCDDATFLRRVSIDLIGLPPTSEQVRAFLADKTPTRQKREKLVDALMRSPDFVDRWANKWADLLNVNSKFLGEQGARKFRNWLHTVVAKNIPYDRFVRELIMASGDSYQNAPANFYRVNRETTVATENITQLFMGVRFNCNKCHDHPFERWTQTQYYQFGANFAQIAHKAGQMPGSEVIYNAGQGEVTHPRTNLAVAPSVPVGKLAKLSADRDRRAAFAQWLTDRNNPFFAKAMVNRLWSYFFGKGIIDPVDDIRAGNPPSNPELLDALTQDFLRTNFDLKHIMRVMVTSRTYQTSISANRWNVDDKSNFSHFYPRRLEAEQLFDAIHQATGTKTRFAGMPEGTRATQLPDAHIAGGNSFLSLFGRPPRESPCECERTSNVSLGQALNLINGPTISDAIATPDGHLARFLKTNPTPKQIVEEVFLSALCRMPTAKEMQTGLTHIQKSAHPAEGAQDLMWALLNSPAFLFNR
jgi:hypothetical protein